MDITIHNHLAIPALISFVGLLVIIITRQRFFSRRRLLWTSITTFLTIYFLVVGSALYVDIYYQWDLNRYDLDHDGTFGGAEITQEQLAAMNRLTNDVGRNFSFITGFIFALKIAFAIYLLGNLTLWVLKICRSSISRDTHS